MLRHILISLFALTLGVGLSGCPGDTTPPDAGLLIPPGGGGGGGGGGDGGSDGGGDPDNSPNTAVFANDAGIDLTVASAVYFNLQPDHFILLSPDATRRDAICANPDLPPSLEAGEGILQLVDAPDPLNGRYTVDSGIAGIYLPDVSSGDLAPALEGEVTVTHFTQRRLVGSFSATLFEFSDSPAPFEASAGGMFDVANCPAPTPHFAGGSGANTVSGTLGFPAQATVLVPAVGDAQFIYFLSPDATAEACSGMNPGYPVELLALGVPDWRPGTYDLDDGAQMLRFSYVPDGGAGTDLELDRGSITITESDGGYAAGTYQGRYTYENGAFGTVEGRFSALPCP